MAECKLFQRIILSGSPVKCKRHCVRADVLFNIFNGLERIFFTFGGKAMQGWSAETGPDLQRVLRNQNYSLKKAGHFDEDEHTGPGLGRNKQLHKYRLENNLENSWSSLEKSMKRSPFSPLSHQEALAGAQLWALLCKNHGG